MYVAIAALGYLIKPVGAVAQVVNGKAGLVGKRFIFTSAKHIKLISSCFGCKASVIAYRHTLRSPDTGFGSHNNPSGRSPGSVNSRSGSILQHTDRLNIVRIYIV